MVLREGARRDPSAPRGRPRRADERGEPAGAPESGRSLSAGRRRAKTPLREKGKKELSLEPEAARAVRELTRERLLGAERPEGARGGRGLPPGPPPGRGALGRSTTTGAPLARHRRSESWGSDALSSDKAWSPPPGDGLVRGASAVPGHTLEASLAGDLRAIPGSQALGSRNGDATWAKECGKGSKDPLEGDIGTDGEERGGRGGSTPGKRLTKQRSVGGSRAGTTEDGVRKGVRGHTPSGKGPKGPSGFQRIASKMFGKARGSYFQKGEEKGEPPVRPRKATWTDQFRKPTRREATPNNSDPLLPTTGHPEDEGFDGGVPLRRPHSDESSDRSLSRSTSFQERHSARGTAEAQVEHAAVSSASSSSRGAAGTGGPRGETARGASVGVRNAGDMGRTEDGGDTQDGNADAAPEAAARGSSGPMKRDVASSNEAKSAKSPSAGSGVPEAAPGRAAGAKEGWIQSSSGSHAGAAAPDDVAVPRGSRPVGAAPRPLSVPAAAELSAPLAAPETPSPGGSTSQSALDDDSVVYHAHPREGASHSELDDLGLEQRSPTAEMTRDFPDPVLVLGRATTRIIAANAAALRALGLRSQGEARRRSLLELMERMPRKEWDDAVGRLMTREVGQVKLKLRLLKSERGGLLSGHRVDLDLHLAGHGQEMELVGLLRKSSASSPGATLHGSLEAHRLGLQGAPLGHHLPQDRSGRPASGTPPDAGREGPGTVQGQGLGQGQGPGPGGLGLARVSPGKAVAPRNVSEPLVRPKVEAPRPKHSSAPLRDGRLAAGAAAPGAPGGGPLMPKRKLLISIPHAPNGGGGDGDDDDEYDSDETDADAPLATPLNSSDVSREGSGRGMQGSTGGAPAVRLSGTAQLPQQEGYQQQEGYRYAEPMLASQAPQRGQRTPRDVDEAVTPSDRPMTSRAARSPGVPQAGRASSGSFAVRKEREAERGGPEKHEDRKDSAGRFVRAPTWNGTEGKARGPAVPGGEGRGRPGSVGARARVSPRVGPGDARGAPEEEAWQSDPQRKGVARVTTWNASDSESRASTGVIQGLGQLLWRKPEGGAGLTNSLGSNLGNSISHSISHSVRLLRPGEAEGRSSSRGRSTPRGGEPLSVVQGGSGPILARTRSAHRADGAGGSSKSPRTPKSLSLEARGRRTSEDGLARRNSATRRDSAGLKEGDGAVPTTSSATSPGAALDRRPSKGRGTPEARGVPSGPSPALPQPLAGGRPRQGHEPGQGPQLNGTASEADLQDEARVSKAMSGPEHRAVQGGAANQEHAPAAAAAAAAAGAGLEGPHEEARWPIGGKTGAVDPFPDDDPASDGEDTVLAQPVGEAERYAGGMPEAPQEVLGWLRERLPVASEMPVARPVSRAEGGSGLERPQLQLQVQTELGEGEEGGAAVWAGEGVQTPGRQMGGPAVPLPRLDSSAGIVQPGPAGQRERKVTFAENVHLRRFVRVGSAKHAAAGASTSPTGPASDGAQGHGHPEAPPTNEPSPSEALAKEGQGRRFVRQSSGRDKEGAQKEPSPRAASFQSPGLPRASSLGEREGKGAAGPAATHYYVPLKEAQGPSGGGPGAFPRSLSGEGEGKAPRGTSPGPVHKASSVPALSPGGAQDDPVLDRARTWSEPEGKGPGPPKGSSGPLVPRASSVRSQPGKAGARNQSASARESRAALRDAAAAAERDLARTLTADRPQRSSRPGVRRGEKGGESKGDAPDTAQQVERLMAKLQEDSGVPREGPAHRSLRSSGAEDEGGGRGLSLQTARGRQGGTPGGHRPSQSPHPRPSNSARESRASRAGSGRHSLHAMPFLEPEAVPHLQHPQQQQQHQHQHQPGQLPHLAHHQPYPQHLHPGPLQHQQEDLHQQHQQQHYEQQHPPHHQQKYEQQHQVQPHVPQAKFRAVGFRSHSERAAPNSAEGFATDSLAAFASDSPLPGLGAPKQWPATKAPLDTRDTPPFSPAQTGSPGHAVARPRGSRLWQMENGGPPPAPSGLGEPPSGVPEGSQDLMAHTEYLQGASGSYQQMPDDINLLGGRGMGPPGVHPGYAVQGVDQHGWAVGPLPGGGRYKGMAPAVPGPFQGMPSGYGVPQGRLSELTGQHWGQSLPGSGGFPWDASWTSGPHHEASLSATAITGYTPAPHE